MAMKLDHEDLNRLIEKISTSDIQEFSLEGEDFKLEIKRNLFDQNQVTNNFVSNNSFDKQTISNKKSNNDNVPIVTETDPGVKGDTASGCTKPAILETGAQVMVPLFISVGEMIKIDTRNDSYLGREN